MAKMVSIKNPTIRLFHGPRIEKKNAKGETEDSFEATFEPRKSTEVPDWYAAELRKHRTWSKRLDGNTIKRPGGAAGTFEQRIIARREGRIDAPVQSPDAALLEENARLKAELEALRKEKPKG